MSSAKHETKQAIKPARIAAFVAILGILIIGIGTKVLHHLLETRSHANATDNRR